MFFGFTDPKHWLNGCKKTRVYGQDSPFILSPLREQAQIVAEIEFRLSVCDKVEQSINESLVKAEALCQSILKKAFEGRLLSEVEVELCKKEADYEPASELLTRIERSRNEKIKADASTRLARGKLAKEHQQNKKGGKNSK